jgi:DNA-binding HxlR family transcriptional regulator
MPRKMQDEYRSDCPINIALELLGDRWSLLIVRDLMFKEIATFNGFLTADEKIATNILTDRLAKLELAGIVSKAPDPADARRICYSLTEKGLALAPVLVELILWADAHEETAAPPAIIAAMKADRRGFIAGIRKRWRDRAKK